MKCDIKTGRVVEPVSSTELFPTTGNGVVGEVFFDSKSTSTVSRVFRVSVNEALILTAFNLSGEHIDNGPDKWQTCEAVEVYKVSPIVHELPRGDSCCGQYGEPDNSVIREEVKAQTDCCAWRLICGSPMAVIALPGYYRLKLTDEAMVGRVYVEGERVAGVPIPNNLIFGG
ncbi:hypothetical protein V757_02920 [Pelistega indica]|uniref:Uncharacterized protein n=1 Tax=Pelistega indica TaxID=1414851 RepID=V8G8C7_9BURK|nr:hypothetical protein [Pelistega indica]ETD72660.1 hypothetical protein V757_02920 [Pelistega indica]